MNFLAHAFLSPDDPEILVGNMVTDFLRGREVVASLAPRVREGVMLHRTIDRFTDEHTITRQTIDRIKGRWGRYSPILVDIFYDHILARDWTRYSNLSLREFADNTYATLRRFKNDDVPGMEWVLRIVVEPDRLPSYATVEGIGDALHRISTRRLKRDPGLQNAVHELRDLDGEITADFHRFFPHLQLAAGRFLDKRENTWQRSCAE